MNFIGDTCFPTKESIVRISNPIILNRKNRKYWYLRYQELFTNGSVKTIEKSTKVSKHERSLQYMENVYLPAWVEKQKFKAEDQDDDKNTDTSFDFFAGLFLLEYESQQDYLNMHYRMKRILNFFGKKDVKKITKLEIRQWVSSLVNEKTKVQLSVNSKKKYLRAIRGVFGLAVDGEILDKNPANNIDIKRSQEEKYSNQDSVKPFSIDEVNKLIQTSESFEYGFLLHFYLGIAFNQGMSPAEILGLKVKDIDLQENSISIKRNITKGKVKYTKTDFRLRTIPIFTESKKYIIALLERAKLKKSPWLFSKGDGLHLNDIKDIRGDNEIIKNDGRLIKKRSKWYKLLYDCDIKYIKLMNCRHTFAVRAVESKEFTLQEIANLLGHANLQMLIDHYAKWIDKKAMSAKISVNLFKVTPSDTFGDSL